MDTPARWVDVKAIRRSVDQMWIDVLAEMADHTSRLAGGATGLAIIVGGSQDVALTWAAPFPDGVGYVVDVVPMGLLGKATTDVVAQDEAGCTVRVTAGLLVAAGTQFLAYGRS